MYGGGLAAQLFVSRPPRVLNSCNQVVYFSTPLCNYSKAWRWRSIAYPRLCLYDVYLLLSWSYITTVRALFPFVYENRYTIMIFALILFSLP
jgi:hypothetical protein